VVVDALDKNFVLIDGPVKRKRCNILHLEPTAKTIKIKKNASHAEVVREFKKELNVEIKERKKKTVKAPKPVKQRKVKQRVEEKKEGQKEHKEEKKEQKRNEKK